MLHARGIVEGTMDEVDSMNRYRFENSTKVVGGLSDVWGFPLILSPVYYFFGLDIFAMKVCVNIFFALSLLMIFFLFHKRLDRLAIILIVSTIALSKWFFVFKENVLSDYPFLFFSLLSLYLIQRFIIDREIWINRFVSYSLIGIFIFISYNIRPVGLVLFPTLLFAQLIEGKTSFNKTGDSFAAYIFISLIPYLVFLIFNIIPALVMSGGSGTWAMNYFLDLTLKDLIFQIKYNLLLPARAFPFLIIKLNKHLFFYSKPSMLLYAIMLLTVFYGMIRNIKKDYLYITYILFTLFIIMTFSDIQGFRLLIPIFPFFLYFLFRGLTGIFAPKFITDIYARLKVNTAIIFFLGLILISPFYIAKAAYQNINFNKTNAAEGAYSKVSSELFDYIKKHTKKSDSIIFRKPRSINLFADRNSFSLRSDFTVEQLRNSPGDYIAYFKEFSSYSLSEQDLKLNFNCMFENEAYLLCAIKNGSNYP
jgi:hypothetical protein